MQERVNKLLSTTCMVERQSGPEPTYHVDRFGGKGLLIKSLFNSHVIIYTMR